MKKYIEVIKKGNKKNTDNNQITEKVTKGYAFNYLIPNGLANVATKGEIKHLKMLRERSSQKKNQIDLLSSHVKSEIMKLKIIHFRKKCGKDYQIFGSITENDLQEKILKLTGQTIEKKQIFIKNIKELGTYQCQITITEEIKTYIEIRLLPYYF